MMTLDAATDRSSWSDDLQVLAGSVIDQYHLAPSRANTLRALDLPSRSTVLEIGARAGALTRYLGETYDVVDALEPDPVMAAIAEARCEGLTSVAVHTMWIDAVPAVPTYDLVVAGDIADALQQHGGSLAALVASSRAALKPGGILLLGFDNDDGVRFLAGEVVDPLGAAADSTPPRWSADTVTQTLEDAGLRSVVLSAFPDHRHTHALFDHDALAAIDRSLLTKLPSYNSQTERELWTNMVTDKTSAPHANSLVVVASESGESPTAVATYFSVGRAAAQSARNRLCVLNGDVVVERGRTFPDAPLADGPLTLRPHTEQFIDGTSMVRALAATTDADEAALLLRAWAELVRDTVQADAPVLWDLIPRNVIVRPDGELCAIDQEWQLDGGSALTVLTRGCFWLAVDLSSVKWGAPWLQGVTIRDRATFLRALTGCKHDANWFETFAEAEANHVSHVWTSSSHRPRSTIVRENWNSLNELSTHHQDQSPTPHASPSTSAALADVINDLSATNSDLRAQIEQLKLQQRRTALTQRDHLVGLNAELEQLRDQLAGQRRAVRRAKLRAIKAEKELVAVRSSSTWRLGRLLTGPLAFLRRKR